MNFLAPLFLIGALAVALPVVFHLIRRTTRERAAFSSLMFLKPTPPRLTRRNRLEHLLLLALRCLILCLLALAFARPFFPHSVPEIPASGPAKRVLVLIDSSASMRRGQLWAEALQLAEAALRKLSPADQAAVFFFARQLTPVMTFEQWNATPLNDRLAVVRHQFSGATPGWAATHTDQALMRAVDLVSETATGQAAGPRRIVLISDMQEGSRTMGLQSFEWPKGIELQVERLRVQPKSNAGLQWAADAAESGRPSEDSVRLRVNNSADSRQEQFQVGWAGASGNGFLGAPLDVYVPPAQSRVVTLPAPTAAGAASRIILRGDGEDFDNVLHVIPPETQRIEVRYFGNEPETDSSQPLYFLHHAFQETRRQAVQIKVSPPGAVPGGEATNAALFIASGALDNAAGHFLREKVSQGKILLFAPVNSAAAESLADFLGVPAFKAPEERPPNYGLLGEIDFRHPLFAPFADVRFSDFTKIHFWRWRNFDVSALPNSRILARFDNGTPALLELPLGKGRVFVFASSWHAADSQLVLSSKFVPLLYSALDLSGGIMTAPMGYLVGDALPVPAELLRANAPLTLQFPDGKTQILAAGTTNLPPVAAPGIYRIESLGKSQRFALNLDPAESRTSLLPIDELERLGAPGSTPVSAGAAAQKIRLQNAELEGRQKLWRWFVVLTLIVLLAETWLAGRTYRQLTTQEGVTP